MKRFVLFLAMVGCGGAPAPFVPDVAQVVDVTPPPSVPADAGTEAAAIVQPTMCQPITCAMWHADCGTFGDGCGGSIDCGVCPMPTVDAGVPVPDAEAASTKDAAPDVVPVHGSYSCPLPGGSLQCDNGGSMSAQFEVARDVNGNPVPCTSSTPQCPSGWVCIGRINGVTETAICP